MLTELQKHLQESNLLPKKSKLLLAVSGGVDSVTLLHLLHNLNKYYGWDIIIAHYDHGVRSDSMLDAGLVGELADKYGYQYLFGKNERSQKTEADLRKSRYDYLERMRRDTGADYIVTAHHGNDRIETALFNTIRGADREGIVALKARRGNIIRPLLPFAKAEIIVFANLQNLPYREDSTNSSLNYTRNYVRNELIPYGSLTFRNFHHNFNKRLAKLEALNSRIRAGLERLEGHLVVLNDQETIEFKRTDFMNLPLEIQKAFLATEIKYLMPALQLSRRVISEALEFIKQTQAGSQYHLPSGLRLVNSYDTVIITSKSGLRPNLEERAFHPLSFAKPFRNELFTVSLQKKSKPNNFSLLAPKIKLYVRNRQAGDRVQPVGMSGSKKLQDIFVDAKVPRHLRDSWPVIVTDRNKVVWVPNLVVDRSYPNLTKDNYFITCEVI